MQKLLLSILIFFCTVANAQSNTIDTIKRPLITEFGKPFGNIASEKIDSKGGSIKSSDGRIELHFPPGALNIETLISIQSSTNTLASGIGAAYKLEPS